MSVRWSPKSKENAKAAGVDLSNWQGWFDRSNITGEKPPMPERLGGSKSNAALAKELSEKYGGKVTERQASKWRNHKIKEPKVI